MYRAPASRRTCRRSAAAAVHPLERRDLLTTFVVSTTADAGPGSLRDAILMANATPAPDDVRFNIPGDGLYHTIAPRSPLPEILAALVIDGRTQPGYLSSPVIEISGALAGAGVDGLTVAAPQSAVRGLAINRFDGHGVVLAGPRPPSPTLPPAPGANGSRVEACYIGTDVTGNVALPNAGAGVRVSASSTFIGSATILQTMPGLPSSSGRNVISGNGFAGVWIAPGTTPGVVSGTTLANNYVGTNAAGNRALGNGREGVLIEAPGMVQVGSPTLTAPSQPPTRNVISGNGASGVRVAFVSAGPMVTIQNNYIGTDASGANAIGNGQNPTQLYRDGVTVSAPATVRVGVPQTGMRNVISGNAGAGVAVYTAQDVQVIGNFIGTDATGNADLGNGGDGVLASGTSSGARVSGNVISGNQGDGVRYAGTTRQVQVAGNYIGTNATGTSALGNGGDGVELIDVGSTGTIGGPGAPTPFPGTTPPPVLSPTATGRNVISANGGNGVAVNSTAATPALVRPHSITGNYIGSDYSGTVPLGNAASGVYLATAAVVVGNPSSGLGNLISANGVNGVTIVGPLGSQPGPVMAGNRIEGNRIGVAAAPRTVPAPGADAIMGNRHHGVAILYSSGNRVGLPGTTQGGNVIANNGGSGVMVQGSSVAQPNSPQSAEGNVITANSIYDNGKLGIDLVAAGEGVTPNDTRNADTGPNRLQNHPVITEAVGVPGSSSVGGRVTIHAEPGRSYRIEIFASLAPDPSGRGEGQAYFTAVTVTTDAGGNGTGVFSGTYTLPPSRLSPSYPVFLTATATEGNRNTSEFSPAVRVTPPQPTPVPLPQGAAQVVARHAFYNNSALDRAGGDDAAVAADKIALLPGGTPSFANVTSYDRGLNGVMVDIAGLPAGATLTPDEFEARSAGSSGVFEVAARPFAVSVRRGAGVNGSDRVTLYWSDNLPTVDGVAPAVRNGWLEVKVLPSAVTGLAQADVFRFGNLAGETGNASAGTLRVDAFDIAGTRAAASGAAAPATSRFDHNRDGVVNAADVAIVRANFSRTLAPPASAPADAAAVAVASSRPAYRPTTAGRITEDLLA